MTCYKRTFGVAVMKGATMRILTGAVVAVTLVVGAGCGGRDDTPATPAATAPQAGAGASAGATAQAAPAAPAAAAAVTEAQVEAAMKQIQQSNGALQKSIKGNMLADAATAAKQLATAFADVERFFQQHKRTDAVTLAQQARTGANDAATAAAAGDATKAAAGAAAVGATCKQCHSVYREGDATTGFRIRAAALTQ